MLIRYLYNSGFALECGRATLLIDVWPQSKDGEGGIGSGEVDGDYLKSRPGPIYLLVSHGTRTTLTGACSTGASCGRISAASSPRTSS